MMDKCPICNRSVRQYQAWSDGTVTKRYYDCWECLLVHVEVLNIQDMHMGCLGVESYPITPVKDTVEEQLTLDNF